MFFKVMFKLDVLVLNAILIDPRDSKEGKNAAECGKGRADVKGSGVAFCGVGSTECVDDLSHQISPWPRRVGMDDMG